MSGYGDMYKDHDRARFLARWVPPDDKDLLRCPEEFREHYRYTLARARSAESQLRTEHAVFNSFKRIIDSC